MHAEAIMNTSDLIGFLTHAIKHAPVYTCILRLKFAYACLDSSKAQACMIRTCQCYLVLRNNSMN